MDAQALIDNGTLKLCPDCRSTLIAARATQCRDCSRRPRPPEAPAIPMASHHGEASISGAALGGLSALPSHTLWLVIHGKPVTQGSMRAVAAGVIKHDKSAALHAWRDSITTEALRACGEDWATVSCPVQLDVVFTVPQPKRLINRFGVSGDGPVPVPAAAKPDVDKLLRAVQDSLSPRESPGRRRFRLIEDDSRIIGGSQFKTYPAPGHTHPWALDRPGAVIRVSPVGLSAAAPSASLAPEGGLPAEAAELHQKAATRLH